eukprot:TRINITY_DN174_c1_g1_i4.p1 TRINITY_DN174_c1_g1~~TRINITY_DN174_c1_g1_i4.p1  ORF type:complete len:133 (-),score=39.61 TRINITY_DN174_c1_g1_i4:305-703(-)
MFVYDNSSSSVALSTNDTRHDIQQIDMTHDTDTQAVTDFQFHDHAATEDLYEAEVGESGDAAIVTDSMNSDDSQCADNVDNEVTIRDIMACLEETAKKMDSFCCSYKEDEDKSTDSGGTVDRGNLCGDETVT